MCGPGKRFAEFSGPYPPSPVYLERPRGHSKTSDLAVMVTWALAFAPRMVRGVAAAADRDQSRLLRDAILRLVRLNPWLGPVLDVQAYVVRNVADGHPGRDSQLEIISSDAGSSFGLLVDFIVCDEVTNWEGDGDLWHSLISAVAKRPSCLIVFILKRWVNSGRFVAMGSPRVCRRVERVVLQHASLARSRHGLQIFRSEQKRIMLVAVYHVLVGSISGSLVAMPSTRATSTQRSRCRARWSATKKVSDSSGVWDCRPSATARLSWYSGPSRNCIASSLQESGQRGCRRWWRGGPAGRPRDGAAGS